MLNRQKLAEKMLDDKSLSDSLEKLIIILTGVRPTPECISYILMKYPRFKQLTLVGVDLALNEKVSEERASELVEFLDDHRENIKTFNDLVQTMSEKFATLFVNEKDLLLDIAEDACSFTDPDSSP